MLALLVGRFHALTRGQAQVIARLGAEAAVERIACVITSANHVGTRRNPLSVETREAMLRPALEASGKPFVLVRVDDIADDDAWPAHVAAAVTAAGVAVEPGRTRVVSSNHEVARLFEGARFVVEQPLVDRMTPSELIALALAGGDWRAQASPGTIAVYERGALDELRRVFAVALTTQDGELAEHRHFDSYAGQMDASLAQKLDDLAPWVVPGCVVDKGCGTGRLLVELSRRWPRSAFVGVDLSREFLRRSDENTYAAADVRLLHGNAADMNVDEGQATTVIFSSIMHEIYTYSGYDHAEVRRAVAAAARELGPGGRILIRDGISPDPPGAPVRLELLDHATAETFFRFAREFKHAEGAAFERLGERTVRLSAHLANEFLCKKDYQQNWAIEVHEEYGARTLAGWSALLVEQGFTVLAARQYVNAWIAHHRYDGAVRLSDDRGAPLPWPATNAVIVGQK